MNDSMNDIQEEKIRQLFQQLKQADESAAPTFDSGLHAIGSRQARRPAFTYVLRLTFATVAIAIIIGGGLFVTKRIREHGEISRVAAVTPSSPEAPSTRPIDSASPGQNVASSAKSYQGHPRFRRHRPLAASELISNWTSPTDFLLNTPGNSLLKTVPNLNDSVLRLQNTPQFERN